MNPGGVSADISLYMEENRVFYLGEPDDDGYSQAVQFELKGRASAHCKLFFNSDDKNFNDGKVYKLSPQDGKFKLEYDGQFRAEGPWTSENKFQSGEFRSYVFRFVRVFFYRGSVVLKIIFKVYLQLWFFDDKVFSFNWRRHIRRHLDLHRPKSYPS